MEQDPEIRCIDVCAKTAMVRHFVQMVAVDDNEMAPASSEAWWGIHKALSEILEFVVAIDAGDLKLTPTAWRGGECVKEDDTEKEVEP